MIKAQKRRSRTSRLSIENLESRQLLAFDLVSDFSTEPNSSFSNRVPLRRNECGAGIGVLHVRRTAGHWL